MAREQRGVTLIELMVVVAIIGILTGIAVVMIQPDGYARTAHGFGSKVSATLESMRIRATSTRKWQRLEVRLNQVVHLEAESPGMAFPTTWTAVRIVEAPTGVEVYAKDDRTHIVPDDSVPSLGAGIGTTIDFAPDGAGDAATIFIRDEADKRRVRVAVYGATGASYVWDEW